MEKVMASPFRDVIISIDLNNGTISEFAQLPTALAAHSSYLIDDKFLVIYGGTNGLRFFDNVIRYDIEKKEWRMLQKYPETQKDSPFFKDGRFAGASAVGADTWLLFGGSSVDKDCNDFLVIKKEHLVEDSNFMVITEIM